MRPCDEAHRRRRAGGLGAGGHRAGDVREPSGATLTSYTTGAGPHTRVHLIIVRDDLADIMHDHPPISASSRLTQRLTFPAPGPTDRPVRARGRLVIGGWRR